MLIILSDLMIGLFLSLNTNSIRIKKNDFTHIKLVSASTSNQLKFSFFFFPPPMWFCWRIDRACHNLLQPSLRTTQCLPSIFSNSPSLCQRLLRYDRLFNSFLVLTPSVVAPKRGFVRLGTLLVSNFYVYWQLNGQTLPLGIKCLFLNHC